MPAGKLEIDVLSGCDCYRKRFARPRFRLHFPLTGASRLNPDERCVAVITYQPIRCCNFDRARGRTGDRALAMSAMSAATQVNG